MSTIVEGESSFSLAAFTHGYASLEQQQESGTQPHSDIYSIGATLYHLLTGQIPIAAGLRDEALQRGLGDPLKPVHDIRPAIPIAVSEIISQAMAIRWWDRINSAEAMRTALERAAQTLPAPNPKPDVSTTLTQTFFRHVRSASDWLILGLSIVIVTATAIGIRWTLTYWPEDPPATKQGTSPPPTEVNAALVIPTDFRPTRLPGHTKSVFSVAFSRDGTMAASGSEDGTAILWDTRTWKEKFDPLTGHKGPVYSVAFSPDAKRLATASADKTIRLWDTQTGAFVKASPHQYSRAVQQLSFSSEGNILASISGEEGHGEEQIHLWYLSTDSPDTLSGHPRGVQAIAFVPGTKTLFSSGYENVSGGHQNTLKLWNLETRTSKKLKAYSYDPRFLVVSSDGKHLARGTTRTIELWSYQSATRQWEEQRPLVGLIGELNSLTFAPDNKTLLATTSSGTIFFWDITSPSGRPISLENDQVRAVQWSSAFSPDGQTLLTGGKSTNNETFLWLWQYPTYPTQSQ